MAVDGALHAAGGVAAYRWGSMLLETSQLAPANGTIVIQTLAALSAGTFLADTKVQQRTSIAVLHELVHLQQDVSTGLGAWDHLATRTAYMHLVSQTRFFVHAGSEPPYRETVAEELENDAVGTAGRHVRDALHAIREETVGARQLAGAPWVTPAVEAYARSTFGIEAADLHVDLRTLLEGEAACLVRDAVTGSRHSEDGGSWIDEHQGLWAFGAMDPVYLDALGLLGDAFFGGLSTDVELAFGVRLLPWVVDLACAYPSPSHLRSWPGDRVAFDPVVRFLAILRAAQALDREAAEQCGAHVWTGRWAEAERVLLGGAQLAYPSTTETYERWLDELDPILAEDDWDVPLFEIRADAFRARLEGHLPKGISAIIDAQTPLQILVGGVGLRGVASGPRLLDVGMLQRRLVAADTDHELVELLHGSGTFHCTRGRAGVCDAVTDRCIQGIRRLGELPAAGVCAVRAELETIGWSLEREI